MLGKGAKTLRNVEKIKEHGKCWMKEGSALKERKKLKIQCKNLKPRKEVPMNGDCSIIMNVCFRGA